MIAENHSEGMNNRRLHRLIDQVGGNVDGQPGYWRFEYHGRQLVIVTDEGFNRMRIMTPIVEESELGLEEMKIILAANYDRAIDAKFATAEGYLWALFNHPLRELSDAQFLDAVEQVKTLADNYGDSYSSSSIKFGGNN